MSFGEKARFEKSDSFKSTGSGLTSLSGTLTSEQARTSVNGAQKEAAKSNTGSSKGLSEAYSKLFTENAKTKQDLAKSQADLTNAQSGLSIADQQKKAVEDEATAALLKNKKKGAVPTDVSAQADTSVGLEDIAGDDPILKAMVDSANEQRDSLNSQLEVLNRQTADADEDTRFMVRQIENMAKQQISRQEKSNEQVVRGAKVAGLSAGLAQYSPETHSGIVQETINEGMALIQDIEFKAMEKKYEAKKDLRDFNYKSYLDSQKLITEYNDLKNQTIIKMYEQLTKEETRARESIKFDNDQADRNAIIIAPELINSTPEQIKQAALANGIEVGALMRAVNDAKYEKESRALDITAKNESIISSRDARYRANNPAPKEEDEEKSMSFSDLQAASERYGLFIKEGLGDDAEKTNLVPSHWTRSDFDGFVKQNPGIKSKSASEKEKAIEKYQNGGQEPVKSKEFDVADYIGSSTNLLKNK